MKSIKIEDSTHDILLYIKYKDRCKGIPNKETTNDAIIFKALCHYALLNHYSLKQLHELIAKYDN